jgi:hypothetical protein
VGSAPESCKYVMDPRTSNCVLISDALLHDCPECNSRLCPAARRVHRHRRQPIFVHHSSKLRAQPQWDHGDLQEVVDHVDEMRRMTEASGSLLNGAHFIGLERVTSMNAASCERSVPWWRDGSLWRNYIIIHIENLLCYR